MMRRVDLCTKVKFSFVDSVVIHNSRKIVNKSVCSWFIWASSSTLFRMSGCCHPLVQSTVMISKPSIYGRRGLKPQIRGLSRTWAKAQTDCYSSPNCLAVITGGGGGAGAGGGRGRGGRGERGE